MASGEYSKFLRRQKEHKIQLFLGSLIYLIAFTGLYYKYVPRIPGFQWILVPLVLIAVGVTAQSIRNGTLLIVFLIPLANSLPYFFSLAGFNPLLFIFYGYALGILLHRLLHPTALNLKNPLFIPAAGASLVVIISALLTFWRYTNFFPLHTSVIFDLSVNVLNVSAGEALRRVLFDSLNFMAGFIWFFAVIAVLKTKKIIHLALTFFAVSTLFSFMFGLYQDISNSGLGNQPFFNETIRINALFTDPNALGVFLALSIPVLAGALMAKKGAGKMVFLLTILAGISLIPDAGSRVGLLGLALGSVFFLLFLIRLGIRDRKENPKLWKLVITHASLAMLLAGLISVYIFTKKEATLYHRIDQNIKSLRVLFNPQAREIILHGRHLTWPAALHMIEEYPVSGTGTGSFTPELPNYFRKYDIAPVKSSTYYRKIPPPDFHIDTAGNYYLHIASEIGLIGLFFFCWIFYLILKRIYRVNFLENDVSERRFLIIGLSSSALAMFIISFLGAHTVHFEIQLTFWLFLGLLYTMLPSDSVSIPPPGRKPEGIPALLKAFAGLLIVVFAVGNAWNSFNSLSLEKRTETFHLIHEFGLYQKEKMDGRPFRWTKDAAGMTVKVDKPVMIVPILASHPDIRKKPVKVKVFSTQNLFKKKTLLKEIVLKDNTWKEIPFHFPDKTGSEFILFFEVSRTWRPKEALGSSDPRSLGIAVGTLRFEDPPQSGMKIPGKKEKILFSLEPSEPENEMGGRLPNITKWDMDISLPEGVFLFKLKAMGQEAGEEWPLFGLWINKKLAGEDWIAPDVWGDYYIRKRLKSGRYRICVEFMNEAFVAQTREHRQIFIEKLEIIALSVF